MGVRGQEGPGRPRLPEEKVRRIHLAVYVSEDEADLLRRAAEDRGHRSFGAWAREVLLRLARQSRKRRRSSRK